MEAAISAFKAPPQIARPPAQRMPQGGAPFPDGERQVSWALGKGARGVRPPPRRDPTPEEIRRHWG
ncbi:MAG: hypothetical protein JSR76_06455 [Verrucomicrobia bacterium]|nr:hypothetical protein [Verrucomicrobiota bacterium]